MLLRFIKIPNIKNSTQLKIYREVSEWLKEHAWKVCKPKGFEGSNPFLSAKQSCLYLRDLQINNWFDI